MTGVVRAPLVVAPQRRDGGQTASLATSQPKKAFLGSRSDEVKSFLQSIIIIREGIYYEGLALDRKILTLALLSCHEDPSLQQLLMFNIDVNRNQRLLGVVRQPHLAATNFVNHHYYFSSE